MKQKFNELLDKPWTTRGYLKLTGIVYIITMIIVAIWYIMYFWDNICNWFESKFSKKKAEKETE